MTDGVPRSLDAFGEGRGNRPPRFMVPDLDTVICGTREVVELLRQTPVTRFRLSIGELSLDIECAAPAADAPRAATAPGGSDVAAAEGPVPHQLTVSAPLMGVFYRRPAPDKDPFVEIGQRVEAGEQVAIVEAMKMMNSVVAIRAGIVREIHVEDGEVVEFDQMLISLEPL